MVADEALHAVVGPLIPLALQVFEKLSGAATLAFGSFSIEVQPLGQRLLEFTQFRFGGLLTPVLAWAVQRRVGEGICERYCGRGR